MNPLTIPNVIARKQKITVPEPTYVQGILRPLTKPKAQAGPAAHSTDEYAVTPTTDDPVSPSAPLAATLFSW